MSRHAHDKRVIDALTRPPADPGSIEPPADLAERIKADVPPELELVPALDEATWTTGRRRVWLAAASVLLAVGAGVVALQVRDRLSDEAAARGAIDSLAATPETASADTPSALRSRPDTEAPASGEPAGQEMAPRPAPPPPPAATVPQGAATETEAAEATAGKDDGSGELRQSVAERMKSLELRRGTAGRVEEAPPAPPSRTSEAGSASDAAAVPGTVTVTSESPLLDERKVSQGTTVSQIELEKVPTARDPWTTVTQTPGVLSDQTNVGGSMSGEETVFTAPKKKDEGAPPTHYTFDQAEGSSPKAQRIPSPDRALSIPDAPPPGGQLAPSTGGTAEPNDQPYGDVFFCDYGTNPFIDSEDDPLSTFGLDVDTGSWGVVRRYLRDGNMPPRSAVRVEELVNAFDYGDPAPRHGDFRVVAEGSATPFAGRRDNPRYRILRFGIHAREVDTSHRKPAVLTFVVDVSGSMAAENRLGLVRKSLSLLLDQLRPDDRVALVVYGSHGHVVLEPTSDLEAIRSAIDRLVPEGATNAEEGLVLGYDLARRAFLPGAINRVILCSDGVANVGRTGPESILARIGAAAHDGIELTTVGFGMGNYNDVLMEQLADRGDGMYAYVDDLDEARRVFVENLTGTLQTIARDAKVQVEVDPQVVARYRLLGYENRDVPDEKFRDDTVDAGEIGAGHTVTALYEIKLRTDVDPRRDGHRTAATLHLRWKSVATGKVEELALPVTVADLAGSWQQAPASLRLASVVAELAEALKRTYWGKEIDLGEVFRQAQRVSAEYPGRLDVAELVTAIGRAARQTGALTKPPVPPEAPDRQPLPEEPPGR